MHIALIIAIIIVFGPTIFKIISILLADFLNGIGKLVFIILALVACFMTAPYGIIIGLISFVLFRKMKQIIVLLKISLMNRDC